MLNVLFWSIGIMLTIFMLLIPGMTVAGILVFANWWQHSIRPIRPLSPWFPLLLVPNCAKNYTRHLILKKPETQWDYLRVKTEICILKRITAIFCLKNVFSLDTYTWLDCNSFRSDWSTVKIENDIISWKAFKKIEHSKQISVN